MRFNSCWSLTFVIQSLHNGTTPYYPLVTCPCFCFVYACFLCLTSIRRFLFVHTGLLLLLLDFLLVRMDLFSNWRRWSLNTNQLSWTIFLQSLIILDSSKQISEKVEACSSIGKRSNPRDFFFPPLSSFSPEIHHVLISTSKAALTFNDFQLFD